MSSPALPRPPPAAAPASPVDGVRRLTLFVLCDGLGDLSSAALGGRTVLQASHRPCMDLLAAHGLTGLVDPVEAGLACGSDVAHLSLLGFDPQLVYRGRGAFESIGAGLDIEQGDVGFKCVFSSLSASEPALVTRRCDRQFEQWGVPLAAALDGAVLPSFPEVEVSVKYATEHRAGVRLRIRRGARPGPVAQDHAASSAASPMLLSDSISGTDPLTDNLPLPLCTPTVESSASASWTSEVVNEADRVFRGILAAHPLNTARRAKGLRGADVLLFRGAGSVSLVTPFAFGGRRGCMVAPTAIIRGIGRSVGMELLPSPPGATGKFDSDFGAKVRAILDAMRPSDSAFAFGFLHVKATDDASHDRDARRKQEMIERVDAALALLMRLLSDGGEGGAHEAVWQVVLTGDHSTPVAVGDHTEHPVPFVVTQLQHLPEFCTPEAVVLRTPALQVLLDCTSAQQLHALVQSDPVRAFDEVSVSRGLLGRFPGREVMPLLEKLRAQMGEATVGAEIATPTLPAKL